MWTLDVRWFFQQYFICQLFFYKSRFSKSNDHREQLSNIEIFKRNATRARDAHTKHAVILSAHMWLSWSDYLLTECVFSTDLLFKPRELKIKKKAFAWKKKAFALKDRRVKASVKKYVKSLGLSRLMAFWLFFSVLFSHHEIHYPFCRLTCSWWALSVWNAEYVLDVNQIIKINQKLFVNRLIELTLALL